MSSDLSESLRKANSELSSINQQINSLKSRRHQLLSEIETIKMKLTREQQDVGKFYGNEFEWSEKIQKKLKSIFKIEQLKPLQEATINATLAKQDVILIMPTGGGKSLCFQLPAAVSNGITIVVSPLISLMEDQLTQLRELNIPTEIFSSQASREEKKRILNLLTDYTSGLKIVYVTPEMLAKSKTFMSQMEKVYRSGRLERLVIDEVHCCSQWGHDFRSDYQFLNVMKKQFPNTPILGLTATATETVIIDIQKILNIEGCVILKDSFFRANLKYIIKPRSSSENKDVLIEEISNLLKTKYKDQSGIIYCLTIKDTEEVSTKLSSHGIASKCYHAQLTGEMRSKVYKKWYRNKVQVIVATVAFGMGINKLDLKFVIHFSMSKSLENYYQETGRAGRDGKPADCILYFRFADVFRTTSLIFTEKNGISNAYHMLAYCLNTTDCRKEQIANYFNDELKEKCNGNCDNCEDGQQFGELDVTKYCNDLITILKHAENLQERMTPLKLIDAWMGKGNKKLRVDKVIAPNDLSRVTCEKIICLLIVDQHLKEEFHFTPYSTISYLVPGPRSHSINKTSIVYNLKPLNKRGSDSSLINGKIKKSKIDEVEIIE